MEEDQEGRIIPKNPSSHPNSSTSGGYVENNLTGGSFQMPMQNMLPSSLAFLAERQRISQSHFYQAQVSPFLRDISLQRQPNLSQFSRTDKINDLVPKHCKAEPVKHDAVNSVKENSPRDKDVALEENDSSDSSSSSSESDSEDDSDSSDDVDHTEVCIQSQETGNASHSSQKACETDTVTVEPSRNEKGSIDSDICSNIQAALVPLSNQSEIRQIEIGQQKVEENQSLQITCETMKNRKAGRSASSEQNLFNIQPGSLKDTGENQTATSKEQGGESALNTHTSKTDDNSNLADSHNKNNAIESLPKSHFVQRSSSQPLSVPGPAITARPVSILGPNPARNLRKRACKDVKVQYFFKSGSEDSDAVPEPPKQKSSRRKTSNPKSVSTPVIKPVETKSKRKQSNPRKNPPSPKLKTFQITLSATVAERWKTVMKHCGFGRKNSDFADHLLNWHTKTAKKDMLACSGHAGKRNKEKRLKQTKEGECQTLCSCDCICDATTLSSHETSEKNVPQSAGYHDGSGNHLTSSDTASNRFQETINISASNPKKRWSQRVRAMQSSPLKKRKWNEGNFKDSSDDCPPTDFDSTDFDEDYVVCSHEKQKRNSTKVVIPLKKSVQTRSKPKTNIKKVPKLIINTKNLKPVRVLKEEDNNNEQLTEYAMEEMHIDSADLDKETKSTERDSPPNDHNSDEDFTISDEMNLSDDTIPSDEEHMRMSDEDYKPTANSKTKRSPRASSTPTQNTDNQSKPKAQRGRKPKVENDTVTKTTTLKKSRRKQGRDNRTPTKPKTSSKTVKHKTVFKTIRDTPWSEFLKTFYCKICPFESVVLKDTICHLVRKHSDITGELIKHLKTVTYVTEDDETVTLFDIVCDKEEDSVENHTEQQSNVLQSNVLPAGSLDSNLTQLSEMAIPSSVPTTQLPIDTSNTSSSHLSHVPSFSALAYTRLSYQPFQAMSQLYSMSHTSGQQGDGHFNTRGINTGGAFFGSDLALLNSTTLYMNSHGQQQVLSTNQDHERQAEQGLESTHHQEHDHLHEQHGGGSSQGHLLQVHNHNLHGEPVTSSQSVQTQPFGHSYTSTYHKHDHNGQQDLILHHKDNLLQPIQVSQHSNVHQNSESGPKVSKHVESRTPTVEAKINPVLTDGNEMTQEATSTPSKSIAITEQDLKKLLEDDKVMDLVELWVKIKTVCPYCGKRIRVTERSHLHRCKGAESIQYVLCDVCGGSYQREYFHLHYTRLHESKKVQCQVCSKYISASSMPKHLYKHKNPPIKFKCGTCAKQFKFRVDLERHELVHRVDKPYKCPTCNRGFTQKTNMAYHMRQHTGDKPYKCNNCQKSFTHNVSLKNHLKKHHGIDLWALGYTGGGRPRKEGEGGGQPLSQAVQPQNADNSEAVQQNRILEEAFAREGIGEASFQRESSGNDAYSQLKLQEELYRDRLAMEGAIMTERYHPSMNRDRQEGSNEFSGERVAKDDFQHNKSPNGTSIAYTMQEQTVQLL